jgi:hypothetical protein
VAAPVCSFSGEVSLDTFPAPADYAAFLRAISQLECVWVPRRDSGWVLFSDKSGLAVLPIWLSHRDAYGYTSRWQRSLEHAPISLSDFIEEWLNGWLPDEARIAVAITSPYEGILVTQHRLWADLCATVEFLP